MDIILVSSSHTHLVLRAVFLSGIDNMLCIYYPPAKKGRLSYSSVCMYVCIFPWHAQELKQLVVFLYPSVVDRFFLVVRVTPGPSNLRKRQN